MEKDISQRLQNRSCVAAPITADGAVNGASVDTQEIQGGLFFSAGAIAYTDGTHVLSFEEADDTGFTVNAGAIDASQLVGSIADISAATANGGVFESVGVLYTRRYVRAVVTSSSVTTGATVIVMATESPDNKPQPATTESN